MSYCLIHFQYKKEEKNYYSIIQSQLFIKREKYQNMRIYIKTLTGKVLHLESDPEDTILDVKNHIREMEGIPED